MYKKIWLGALLSSILVTGLVNAEEKAAAEVDTKMLVAKLKPLFGGEPDSLKPTAVPGVYEAVFGMEMIYVSADGRYFFSGDMIDGETRINLTEATRTSARLAELKKVDVKQTVEFKAKGEQKHVLSVFTDVDCPYCVKLHKEVPALNEAGVTVRYFAYPRAGVGSGSYKKMVDIWCASDQQDAMTRSKNGETLEAKDCPNPVADQFALGQKVGVTGTPALITDAGALIPGYRPADQLVKMLDEMAVN